MDEHLQQDSAPAPLKRYGFGVLMGNVGMYEDERGEFVKLADVQSSAWFEPLRWQPVAAGLPDAETNVLLALADGTTCEGFYDGHWEHLDGQPPLFRDVCADPLDVDVVIAWADMPGGPARRHPPADGVTAVDPASDSACLKRVVEVSGFAERAKPDEDIIDYVARLAHGVMGSAPAQESEVATAEELRTALHEMIERKDGAYEERNKVVAALAKVFPSGVARTAIEGWSEDWHGCVYIDLPTGQVSWHFHDSQAHLFAGLPPYTGAWDGHDTPEKYRRLAALPHGVTGAHDQTFSRHTPMGGGGTL